MRCCLGAISPAPRPRSQSAGQRRPVAPAYLAGFPLDRLAVSCRHFRRPAARPVVCVAEVRSGLPSHDSIACCDKSTRSILSSHETSPPPPSCSAPTGISRLRERQRQCPAQGALPGWSTLLLPTPQHHFRGIVSTLDSLAAFQRNPHLRPEHYPPSCPDDANHDPHEYRTRSCPPSLPRLQVVDITARSQDAGRAECKSVGNNPILEPPPFPPRRTQTRTSTSDGTLAQDSIRPQHHPGRYLYLANPQCLSPRHPGDCPVDLRTADATLCLRAPLLTLSRCSSSELALLLRPPLLVWSLDNRPTPTHLHRRRGGNRFHSNETLHGRPLHRHGPPPAPSPHIPPSPRTSPGPPPTTAPALNRAPSLPRRQDTTLRTHREQHDRSPHKSRR